MKICNPRMGASLRERDMPAPPEGVAVMGILNIGANARKSSEQC